MTEIKIRNIDKQIVAGLDDMAAKKGISRNELLKIILQNQVEMEGIRNVENRYETLILKLEDVLQNNMIINKRLLDFLENNSN